MSHLDRLARALELDPAVESRCEPRTRAEDLTRIRRLLMGADPEHQRQALQLLGSLNDRVAWENVVQGCGIREDGSFESKELKISHGVFQAFCQNPFADHSELCNLNLAGSRWLRLEDLACLQNLPVVVRYRRNSYSGEEDFAWGKSGEILAKYKNRLAFFIALRDQDIAALQSFTEQRTVDLSGTSLSSVSALRQLPLLENLDLGGCNQLREVEGLAELENLVDLDLTWNKAHFVEGKQFLTREIKGVSPNLRPMKDLHDSLRIGIAIRDDDAQTLEQFRELQTLTLHHWPAEHIRGIRHLVCAAIVQLPALPLGIESIGLQGTGVESLEALCRLTQLTHFMISDCKRLKSLRGLPQAPGVHYLGLEDVGLETLDGVEGLTGVGRMALCRCESLVDMTAEADRPGRPGRGRDLAGEDCPGAQAQRQVRAAARVRSPPD